MFWVFAVVLFYISKWVCPEKLEILKKALDVDGPFPFDFLPAAGRHQCNVAQFLFPETTLLCIKSGPVPE